MTTDDVLATIAALPKKDRPTELKSDTAMLKAWLSLRTDRAFFADVIIRHNLRDVPASELTKHDHAYGNAIGHCVHVIVADRQSRVCEQLHRRA